MSEEKALSYRQKGILDFIYNYGHEHGRPPTIREIGKEVKITSTSVVNYNLSCLEKKGLLEREADVSRGLRLSDHALQKFYQISSQLARLVRVPMLGIIKAGLPIDVGNGDFSTFDEGDAIELSASMLPGKQKDLFALRVSGDSMIDAMVNDGDIVILKKQETARNGEMVAVWVTPEGTTLKYFHHEGERVRLQPANPTMDPIYVKPSDVQVQGKVMMVLRQTAA